MKQAYDAGAEVGEVARLGDGAYGAYVADSTFLDSLSTTAFRERDDGSHVGHGDCDDGQLEESVELHATGKADGTFSTEQGRSEMKDLLGSVGSVANSGT